MILAASLLELFSLPLHYRIHASSSPKKGVTLLVLLSRLLLFLLAQPLPSRNIIFFGDLTGAAASKPAFLKSHSLVEIEYEIFCPRGVERIFQSTEPIYLKLINYNRTLPRPLKILILENHITILSIGCMGL